MRSYFNSLLTTLLWIGPVLAVNVWAAVSDRPNVVLIMTDNQGYFELGCKGNPHVKTPSIDAFAQQSVDFCNFHAENFCSPSRAALLTGRQPMRFGVYNTIGGVSLLAAGEVTLADRLKAVGYRTAIFGKWHLGMSYPFHPRYRGFEEVFIHGGGGIGQLEDYLANRHLDAHFEDNGEWVESIGFSTDVLFDRASQFIRSCGDKPFFCYIPTPATHFPVQSEPASLARIKQRGLTQADGSLSLYSMIENIDDNVGRLLSRLDRWNLSDNTLVIFMTDQGVGDRGSPTPVWPGKDRNADLGNASEGKHRVFCMMQKPGLTAAGENYALTCIRDICPTVLDLCGVQIPTDLDGQSLLPLLRGDADWQDERTLVMQCPRNRKRSKWRHASVKRGDWRLVSDGRLYDIAKDSLQQNNVAQQHPEIVAELNTAYEEFWNSLPPEASLLPRNVLGAPEAPHTELCAMDWYKGDAPWAQGKKPLPTINKQGVWAVEVDRAGRYQFSLRSTRKETPLPIEATSAEIEIGEVKEQVAINRQDTVAVLTAELTPGSYDFQTRFQAAGEDSEGWGALFVDVAYLND